MITFVLSAAIEAGTVLGEYRIERPIAEGGMGSVYYATHPVIGKAAAVKVMSSVDPAAMKRFIQEARAVNQISHPNIVDIFSFGEMHDGRGYLVMELVDGECLADVLDGEVAMPIADVLAIIEQLADAIDAAHRAGVVHRDLKPDNVMLVEVADGRKQAKLLDFGIAKLANPEEDGVMGRRTRTGLVLGTPNYMSPEQARGKHVDHRTDIYALGCVAFEMIAGRVPFKADNPTDSVIMHVQDPVPSLRTFRPDAPVVLDKLVRAMLAKRPDNRPTLEQVRKILAHIAAAQGERSDYASATFTERIGQMRARMTEVRAEIDAVLVTRPSPAFAGAASRQGRLLRFAVAASVVVGVGIVTWFASAGLRGPASTSAPVQPSAEASAEAARAAVPAGAPGAELASVEVAVNVDAADIYIDGQSRGTAKPTLLVEELKPGNHRLEVRADGYQSWVRSVQVVRGQSLRMSVDIASGRLDLTEPVEPKAEPRDRARRKKQARPAVTKPKTTPESAASTAPAEDDSKNQQTRKSSKSGPNDIDYTVDPFAK